MLHRIVIPRHERGFLYTEGEFRRMLAPGTHWILEPFRKVEVKRVSLLEPRIMLPDVEILARDPDVASQVRTVRIKDTERGLVFREDNFHGFLGPGFHAFLLTPTDWRVEVVDASDPELVHKRKNLIAGAQGSGLFLQLVEVPQGHRAVLFYDNVAERVLEPGRYLFWLGVRAIKAEVVDLRENACELNGQELMTQDKVSLRMNFAARFLVVDVARALGQASWWHALYRDLQLALRDEVGTRTLDDLLARKDDLGAAVVARVRDVAEAMGVRVLGAGLRDVILPGEMRTILNQVIEAEKRAQANMIARREETAATRNLMNTAKLLENNPVLMHLKELESTERIAEKIGSLSVVGGLDGLMDTLKRITTRGDHDRR